ncbi:MAG: hypothetical protein KAS32_10765 [Candidatus Peribacteraceae bacterium]|nr:hypothetical protein [Candidatus Peribacteraceae bacterium]
MSTQVQIYNLALLRLGEALLTSTADNTNPARSCNAIYDQVLEETLAMGPEFGWRFASTRGSVDIDSISISAFADYGSTVTGTVLATAATHGFQSGESVSITDTTNYDGTKIIIVVDDDSFYFTDTFAATETGTAKWTSDEFAYRYARPTSIRITSISVGGQELTDWELEGQYILTSLEQSTVVVKYVQSITDTSLFPSHFVKILYMNMAVHLAYDLVQSRTLSEQLIRELENVYMPRAIAIDAKELYVEEDNQNWQNAGHTTINLI